MYVCLLFRDTFELRARDVSSVVSSLRDFLLDNRGLYLGDGDGAQEDDESSSSSLARDKIDAGAASHISTCQGLIRGLRSDVRSAAAAGEAGGEMRARHLEAVCTLLEAALKSACSVYAELKAIRVQKEVEFQRLSRLEFKARKGSFSIESGEKSFLFDSVFIILQKASLARPLRSGSERSGGGWRSTRH